MGTSRWAGLGLIALAGLLTAAAPHTSTPERRAVLALNAITGNTAILGKVEELTASPETTKKLLAVAATMCKDKEPAIGRNTALMLGRVAENLKQTDAGIELYKALARHAARRDSTRGIATALLGMLELNFSAKRYAEAEKVCKAVMGLETSDDDPLDEVKGLAFRRMVTAIARQGQGDRAIKAVDDEIKAQPRNFTMIALKAQLLQELERFDEAIKAYQQVIERVGKDRSLDRELREEVMNEYRYILSGVYTDADKIDKAAEVLKELLAKDPNNPTYNNDLGFIWADRGMNLEEAEKMIRKAIEEDRKQRRKATKGVTPKDDKDNSSFLDSLGWVLYKRGKHAEAKPHLLEAVKDVRGQHLEIFDHLGDVHMALGEKAEAVAAWKKGLEHMSDSRRDKKRKVEVEKKLKDAMAKKD
jgi:tetratricopeptide (TPR) repeat protein